MINDNAFLLFFQYQYTNKKKNIPLKSALCCLLIDQFLYYIIIIISNYIIFTLDQAIISLQIEMICIEIRINVIL